MLPNTQFVISNIPRKSFIVFSKNWTFFSISLRCTFDVLPWPRWDCTCLELRNQKISLCSSKHLSVARFYKLIAANPGQVQLMCQLNITDVQWMTSVNIFPMLPIQTLFALYKWLQGSSNSVLYINMPSCTKSFTQKALKHSDKHKSKIVAKQVLFCDTH